MEHMVRQIMMTVAGIEKSVGRKVGLDLDVVQVFVFLFQGGHVFLFQANFLRMGTNDDLIIFLPQRVDDGFKAAVNDVVILP